MKTRKIALLAGIAVLVCLCIAQTINAHRSPVKAFTLKDEPDTITIVSATNGTLTLNKIGETWLIDNLPTEENAVYFLTTALNSIKTLGVASRGNSESDLQRYGLDDMSKITVTASKNGVLLRTLVLGKAATNADQTYVRVDGASETLIASGNLHGQFDVTAEDLLAPPPEEENETDVVEE